MPFDPHVPQGAITDTVALLSAARASISDKRFWGQNFFRDGPRACAVGAIYRALDVTGAMQLRELQTPLSRLAIRQLGAGLPWLWRRREARWQATTGYGEYGTSPLMAYNDTHSHADVLRMYDRAIKKAKASRAAAIR